MKTTLRMSCVCVGLALMLTTGCVSFLDVQKAFGMVDDLKGKQVDDVVLSHEGGGAVCPGAPVKLIAKVKAGGLEYVTTGVGGGSLLWRSVHVRSDAGQVRKSGDDMVLTLSSEARDFDGASITLEGRLTDNPGLKVAPYTIPLRFDCNYVANFDGERGRRGRRGSDGYDVRGKWGDGGNGGPGGPGGPGSPGTGHTCFPKCSPCGATQCSAVSVLPKPRQAPTSVGASKSQLISGQMQQAIL